MTALAAIARRSIVRVASRLAAPATAAHSIARRTAAPSLPRSSLLQARSMSSNSSWGPRHAPEEPENEGAQFVQADSPAEQEEQDFSQRPEAGDPQQQQDSLNAPPRSQQRTGGALNILAPRQRGRAGTSRADDPATRSNMIGQINKLSIVSETDVSVPIGTAGAGGSSKARPQKGGRAIGPAEVVEQRGKLTPIQLHRALVTMQLERGKAEPHWTPERVASQFEIDPAMVSALRRHLSLPYVFPYEHLWVGTDREPPGIAVQQALGNKPEIHFLGEHLKLEKKE